MTLIAGESEALRFPGMEPDVADEINPATFVDDLIRDMYVAVPDLPADRFLELADAYEAIMRELPPPPDSYIERFYNPDTDEVAIHPEQDEVKYWHTYRTRAEKPGKPAGITNRSVENRVLGPLGHEKRQATDPKEYIHFHQDLRQILEQYHEANDWGPIPTEVLRFLEIAAPIHAHGNEIYKQALQAMEWHVAFSGISKVLLNPDGTVPDNPMRFLAYHPGQSDVLGQWHTDKGAATLARWESEPGCRVDIDAGSVWDEASQKWIHPNVTKSEEGITVGGNMKLIERPAGSAAFFIAATFARLIGETRHLAVRPTGHDIIDVEPNGSPHSQTIERIAVINFFNGPGNTVFASKNENHANS